MAGLAHAAHDGYTDMIYTLLPVWQAEFAMSYAALALLRGLYAGAMAVLQIPAARLAERFGGRQVLVAGTLLAALGYALAGLSGGIIGLCAALTLSGAGSSVQHPIASSAVSRAYGAAARGPLGTYNFAGDLGKAALPALVALLITVQPWRHALWLMALVGVATAAAIATLMPVIAPPPKSATGTPARRTGSAQSARSVAADSAGVRATDRSAPRRSAFPLLMVIGILDTSVRMGLLTFLPFMLQEKGAALPTIGLALGLVFIGGAAGKFLCGWLGSRVGVLWTVLLTEGGTAICILAALFLPLLPLLVLLPLLGLMLNGTSSVLYGTVPELTRPDRTERAFALFYTGTIGAGALAPVLFGLIGDGFGPRAAVMTTAMTALVILPLAFVLAPSISRR